MILMGYNIYMPVYLQEQLHLSPLQSGFVVFPISIAWLILNFSLDKLELKFSRRGLYLFAFTLLISLRRLNTIGERNTIIYCL
jgi:DHA2 family multidrug resistance protein-like MFS transporter